MPLTEPQRNATYQTTTKYHLPNHNTMQPTRALNNATLSDYTTIQPITLQHIAKYQHHAT